MSEAKELLIEMAADFDPLKQAARMLSNALHKDYQDTLAVLATSCSGSAYGLLKLQDYYGITRKEIVSFGGVADPRTFEEIRRLEQAIIKAVKARCQ